MQTEQQHEPREEVFCLVTLMISVVMGFVMATALLEIEYDDMTLLQVSSCNETGVRGETMVKRAKCQLFDSFRTYRRSF